MVNTRCCTTATPEKPAPRPLDRQRSGGPFLGHSLRSPVSVEMPSRFTPRHCGQSLATAKGGCQRAQVRSAIIPSVLDCFIITIAARGLFRHKLTSILRFGTG